MPKDDQHKDWLNAAFDAMLTPKKWDGETARYADECNAAHNPPTHAGTTGVSSQIVGRHFSECRATLEGRSRAYRYSDEQKKILGDAYAINHYPPPGDKMIIMMDTGLSYDQIKNWFEQKAKMLRAATGEPSGRRGDSKFATQMWKEYKLDPAGYVQQLRAGLIDPVNGQVINPVLGRLNTPVAPVQGLVNIMGNQTVHQPIHMGNQQQGIMQGYAMVPVTNTAVYGGSSGGSGMSHDTNSFQQGSQQAVSPRANVGLRSSSPIFPYSLPGARLSRSNGSMADNYQPRNLSHHLAPPSRQSPVNHQGRLQPPIVSRQFPPSAQQSQVKQSHYGQGYPARQMFEATSGEMENTQELWERLHSPTPEMSFTSEPLFANSQASMSNTQQFTEQPQATPPADSIARPAKKRRESDDSDDSDDSDNAKKSRKRRRTQEKTMPSMSQNTQGSNDSSFNGTQALYTPLESFDKIFGITRPQTASPVQPAFSLPIGTGGGSGYHGELAQSPEIVPAVSDPGLYEFPQFDFGSAPVDQVSDNTEGIDLMPYIPQLPPSDMNSYPLDPELSEESLLNDGDGNGNEYTELLEDASQGFDVYDFQSNNNEVEIGSAESLELAQDPLDVWYLKEFGWNTWPEAQGSAAEDTHSGDGEFELETPD